MNLKKRQHFKKLLLAELRRHAQHIDDEQARALDITNASDLVTVSWSHFGAHDKVMLIGSSVCTTGR